MCTVRCFFILIISIGIFSCNSNKGDKLRDFYLSQPRDKNLFGWWDRGFRAGDVMGKKFLQYTDGEERAYETGPDGKLGDGEVWYWYTKDNILFTCYPSNSWIYGSAERDKEYKILNDTLYRRSVGSSRPMEALGVRTQSPL